MCTCRELAAAAQTGCAARRTAAGVGHAPTLPVEGQLGFAAQFQCGQQGLAHAGQGAQPGRQLRQIACLERVAPRLVRQTGGPACWPASRVPGPAAGRWRAQGEQVRLSWPRTSAPSRCSQSWLSCSSRPVHWPCAVSGHQNPRSGRTGGLRLTHGVATALPAALSGVAGVLRSMVSAMSVAWGVACAVALAGACAGRAAAGLNDQAGHQGGFEQGVQLVQRHGFEHKLKPWAVVWPVRRSGYLALYCLGPRAVEAGTSSPWALARAIDLQRGHRQGGPGPRGRWPALFRSTSQLPAGLAGSGCGRAGLGKLSLVPRI